MIGDIMLFFKKLKKETFCIHDYQYPTWMSIQKQCTKCGRDKK